MKKKLLVLALLCWSVLGSLTPVAAQKSITIDDCFTFFKFYPQSGTDFQYLGDGLRYAHADRDGNLHIRDLRDEQFDSTITLVLPEKMRDFDRFEFNESQSKVLLRTEAEPVYRHSVRARYVVYDFETKAAVPVFEAEKQQFVAFSPDGEKLAFVCRNNLFVKDLAANRVSQITHDGAENKIINGLPDWVYEEEFSPVDGNGMVATRWSPDGSKLAFIRFDETAVPEVSLTWYEGELYPRNSQFKFPKVGKANSTVSVHLYDVEEENMMGQLMGLDHSDYCPRIHWTEDNQLVMARLNRRQDTLELLLALPERSLYDQEDRIRWIPTRLLLRETDPAYVEIESENKLIFLKDNRHFLWMSDRNGWNHIYRHTLDAASTPPVPLTFGAFDVTAFYGVDEKNERFYFQAATPTPLDRQIWEGNLNGGDPRLLTPPSGTHEASFSPPRPPRPRPRAREDLAHRQKKPSHARHRLHRHESAKDRGRTRPPEPPPPSSRLARAQKTR